MRIGLNLLHAIPEIGGGWNYIANLVSALQSYDRQNHYIAFVNSASERLVCPAPNFTVIRCPVNASIRPIRVLYENTLLQALAGRYRLDCMHWFANTQAVFNRTPAVVTIYDLQPLLRHSKYLWVKEKYLRTMLRMTAKKAPMLLPMSHATANDLHNLLGVDSVRMTVVPVIIEQLFKPAPATDVDKIKSKYHLPDRFWLYVAHYYPHKNHVRLLQTYHQLKVSGRKPWALVLRGDGLQASSEVRHHILQLGLESDVIFLPRLERFELPKLYSSASALVFPSLYEGGGIPVVEAMACGCTLVASRLPPIEEFAGEAALYFDPLDVKTIAENMLRIETDEELREQYRQEGLKRAENHRADRIVPILLDAYRRATAH